MRKYRCKYKFKIKCKWRYLEALLINSTPLRACQCQWGGEGLPALQHSSVLYEIYHRGGSEFHGWGGPPCPVKKLGFRWFLSFWWQWVWLENIQRWFIILVAMKFWPPVLAEHWEGGDHSPRQADHFDQGLNPPGDDSDHKLIMMILIMIMIIMIMILPKQIRLTKSGPTT